MHLRGRPSGIVRGCVMKEKIDEFAVTQLLTAARRKALDQLIAANAGRSPWPISHTWADSGDRLEVTTKPVEWEVVFHPDKVEVFGRGPLWARLLFTKKKRALLHDGIAEALNRLGFLDPKKAIRPKTPGKKKPA